MQLTLLMLAASLNASAATNKEIIQDFFQNYSDGNAAAAFAHVDAEVEWWVPQSLPFGGTFNKKGYLTQVLPRFRGFKGGLKLKVLDLVGEGDQIAAEVESFGVHRCGKPEAFRYHNHYHFKFTLKDNRIVAVKEYMDTHHLFALYELMESKDCQDLLSSAP